MNEPKGDESKISVEVLLSGLHSRVIELPANDPLLRDLFQALATKHDCDPARPTVFRLPVDGGNKVLSFPVTSLISIITEPPLLIQFETEDLGFQEQHPRR